jgi:hypothetical protein
LTATVMSMWFVQDHFSLFPMLVQRLGGIYHRGTCGYLREGRHCPWVLVRVPREGRPCSRCRPDLYVRTEEGQAHLQATVEAVTRWTNESWRRKSRGRRASVRQRRPSLRDV